MSVFTLIFRLCFALVLLSGSAVFAAATPSVIFADDFSASEADGSPSLDIWGGAPRNQDIPAQSILVMEEGADGFFGTPGPYLRIFANGANSNSIWLTANRQFSTPAKVVTVSFDFYNPDSDNNGPRLRLGDADSIFNANRVRQDVIFEGQGSLSGVAGVFQPGKMHHIRVIYNNSTEDLENYHGAATLEADAFDVWVDGHRVLGSHRWNESASGLPLGADIRSLSFGIFGSDAAEFLIRDLEVFTGAVPGDDAEPVVEDEGTAVYYMAPDGSDANVGTAPDQPVASLERVHQLLTMRQPDGDVRVLIEPGTYYGQQVVWTYTRPEYSVTFEPVSADAAMPVFDGGVPDEGGEISYNGGTWFRLNHSSGEQTNLVFRRLRIQNYQDAISLNGNRNDPSRFNSHNTITECYFYRIGNISNSDLSPSTAVIRFVNSQDNVVDNNDFVDVINTTSGGLIHATYIAHLSDGNRITRNRFINHSGDPVRVRDFSNFNEIRDNIFIRAGTGGGYTEWYCDQDARDDCTKPEPECPSWENEFRDNFLISRYNGGYLRTFQFFQGDSTTGCEPVFDGASRLYTSGNTRPESVSSYELWLHRYFAPAARTNDEFAAPEASPVGDGVENIVKYALGLDPRRPAPPALLPTAVKDSEGRLAIRFPVNTDVEGVEIITEVSTDLRSWKSGSDYLEEAESFIEEGRKWQIVRENPETAPSPRRFLRVRFEQVP